MKAKQILKRSWLASAIALVIIIAELAASIAAYCLGFENHPLMVAFLALGLVTAMAAVLYEGVDLN